MHMMTCAAPCLCVCAHVGRPCGADVRKVSSHESAIWHPWAWQKRAYVRMHVHCENRSLIQSLALMRSAMRNNERKTETQAQLLHYIIVFSRSDATLNSSRNIWLRKYGNLSCLTDVNGMRVNGEPLQLHAVYKRLFFFLLQVTQESMHSSHVDCIWTCNEIECSYG